MAAVRLASLASAGYASETEACCSTSMRGSGAAPRMGLRFGFSHLAVESLSSLGALRSEAPVKGRRELRWREEKLRTVECAVRAFSLDATEEARREALETSYQAPSGLKVGAPGENRADDTSLHNPLLRQHRMGCGWLGVILEWEGVIVEDDAELERKSWAALAEEEGRRPPPTFVLRRAEGMKNEQAIMEVLCWTRDVMQVRRMAARKEELYEEMQGGTYRLLPGSREFVESLKKFDVPIAVASTRPRRYLERAVEAVGMEGFFSLVLAAEDVHRGKPDPEMFVYAASRLDFIPERCVVFGNSNTSVEAAHDALMKCVAVAGKHPVFELGAADLVVRRLDDLSVVDLKNLADLDSPEFRIPEPLPELEPETEVQRPKIGTLDW